MQRLLLLLLLGRALGYSTSRPPLIPPTFEIRTFEQTLDHFSSYGWNRTFTQRYLFNDTFAREGPGRSPPPVVFYTGGEGGPVEGVWTHSGFIVELAERLGATLVFAECRYFGLSLPFGERGSVEPRADRVGYLSVEQVLADYAALIDHLRESGQVHGAGPVVTVGGSLPGTLAAAMRMKFPHLVAAALASSAPVLGYPGLCDEYGWEAVGSKAFEAQGGRSCVEALRAGFTAMAEAPLEELSKFTCLPTTEERQRGELVAQYKSVLENMPTGAYPPELSPLPEACARALKASSAGDALGVVPAASGRTGCVNVTAGSETMGGPTPPPGLRLGTRAAAFDEPGEAWGYLACTEITHPISSNNVTDFYPPGRWTVGGISPWCEYHWGVKPRPGWMPSWAGFEALRKGRDSGASRIIFSNGGLDPWSAMGVTEDLSETLVAVLIEGASHHSDLGGGNNPRPVESDSPAMKAARGREVKLLEQWLADAEAERKGLARMPTAAPAGAAAPAR